MRFDQFTGGSYTLSSVSAACQRTLNLYPELIETGGEKGKYRLAGTPGHTLFADLTTYDAAAHPVRGLFSGGGRLFVAAGTKYMEINPSTGALITGSVRTIADDASHSPVKILANGNQLLFISAGNVYCDNGSGPGSALGLSAGLAGTVNPSGGTAIVRLTGDVFTPDLVGGTITINGTAYTVAYWISEDDLVITSSAAAQPNPSNYTASPSLKSNSGAFLDGYFVINRLIPTLYTGSGKNFNISNLRNGLIWDALDFAVKEGYPDNIVCVWADHQELWIFGADTAEVWRNTGNPDFPFQRDPSAVLHMGNAVPNATTSLGGSLFFISSDQRGDWVAYRMNGFSPVRVSTHAVEEAWRVGLLSGLGVFDAANLITGYPRVMAGHPCWVICCGPVAWVYDLATEMWHEETTSMEATDDGSREMKHHAYIPEANRHVVGGDSGKLWTASLDTYTDDGNAKTRIRTSPHLVSEQKRTAYHHMILDMEFGSSIGGSVAPSVTLRWANDGTVPTALSTSLTVSGDLRSAKRPPMLRRLGAARDRVFQLEISGKSKVSINNVYLETTAGDA